MAAPFDPALVQTLVAEGSRDDHAPGRPIPRVAAAEHRNHTPFPSQYFQAVDPHGEVFHVVALRVTYDMHGAVHDDGSLAYAEEQTPLVTEDAWDGPPHEGCPLWESDFAPFKPRCDVLVAGAVSRPPPGAVNRLMRSAAPQSTRWGCGLSLHWSGRDGSRWRWIKHLAVTGPRRYGRLGLGEPQRCTEVAIDWRLACGGQLKRPALDERDAAGQVTRAAGSQRWDVDLRNPVGLGLDPSPGAAAPQIEASMERPYTGGPVADYPAVGLGPVGRTWMPRRALAGTHDDAWLAHQWPLPPLDFDMGYWNCAPADQQIDYPTPGARLSLLRLEPPAGQPPLATTHGVWRGQLPAEQPFLLWRLHAGAMVIRPLNLDTLVIDLTSQQICATYRGVLSARADVRVAEARLADASDDLGF